MKLFFRHGSFKRQIILTFVVGFFLLIAAFAAHMVESERTYLYRGSTREASNLAESLAASSVSWVLANDVAGLQEVVHSFHNQPALRYVMIVSLSGRVLAHGDATKVGQYVSDPQSLGLIKAPPAPRVMADNTSVIDVAAPVHAGSRHIAWARIALGREGIHANLRDMALRSVSFVLAAAILSLFAAVLIARRLGARIGSLVAVAEQVQAGHPEVRANIADRQDEITLLAGSLNRMLDGLAQKEQALHEASRYTRSLIEASLDPLVTISLEGKITDVNRATEQVTGRPRAELIGTDFSGYFTDPSKAREGYRRVFHEGAVTDFPLAIRHTNGRVTEVLYNASVFRDEHEEVSGVFAAARDVTERKRTEEALQHLNRELQAISKCNEALMRAEDEQTLLNDVCDIICHEAGYRMAWVGYAEHDAAMTVRPVAWAGAEDGYLAMANITWAETERGCGPAGECIRTRKSVCSQDFEHDPHMTPWRAAALQRGYRSCIGLPLENALGTVLGALVIYSSEPDAFTADETRLLEELAGDLAFGIFALRARAESQRVDALRAQLAAIVESSNDAIVGKTPEGIITHWNKSAEKIYGYAADEVIGQSVTMLAPPELHAEIHAMLEKIRKGETIVNHESRRIRKDGTMIDVELTLSPIRDDAGNISGVSTIARDITERKQNEEELRRYKDHLEEEVQQRTADLVLARNAAEAANQAKSVFLASMSHELRTPLNAILGFSSIMRKDSGLREDQRQNLDIINRSGGHLLTLINDVLEMAKIEAGRVQLDEAPFDLGAMVRDVTDMMQIRAQEKSLRLLIDQDSRFPRFIVGDEARLRQILINLVGNAVKFTQQGGVTIRLGTKHNAISHLLIEVEDSGAGISPEDQQRVFEPFVQLGAQGDNKGTGLGLTITRQFVQLMGGTISLQSTPGTGSLFRIELPLREAAETDVIQVHASTTGEVVGLAPGQPVYRILIVEDQRDNQLLLSKLMESVGFQVKVAEDGEQGVQQFQQWHPHFIWMDRRMPVMDGLEAARRIRKLPGGSEVKIVAVTASAFQEQRAEMLEAGMDDFVRKPYRSSEIYDCLSRQLGVSYVYDGASETAGEPITLTHEMMRVLPEALRTELAGALESLEGERIDQAIRRVGEYDNALQQMLARLVATYDYPVILKALRSNGSGT